MKGVIAKDLYEYFGIRKNLIYTCLYLIFIIGAIFTKNVFPIYIIIIYIGPMILSPNILQITTGADDVSGFSYLQLTYPIKRNEIVNGKYIIGIFSYLFNMLLSTLMLFLNNKVTGAIKIEYIPYILVLILIISMISFGVNYPVYMLFGSKSISTYIWIGAMIVGSWIVSALFFNLHTVNNITVSDIHKILSIALIVSLIISLIGYFITLYFYNKKDFA